MAESILRTSYALAVRIVKLRNLLQSERAEYQMSKQLFRSGTSIGANIREAQNAESKADFIHKLHVALKECNETMYWLELMRDTGYLSADEFKSIYDDSNEVYKMLSSSIISNKSKLKLT
jgi:four helix bundle protein